MKMPGAKFSKLDKQVRKNLAHIVFALSMMLLLFTFFIPLEADHVVAQTETLLQVTFIDVGQGDSALLRSTDGWDILIDAGPRSAGQTVVDFLIAEGVTDLEVVMMSHNHEDHIGGLVAVLQSGIGVDMVLYNGNSCSTLICQDVWDELGVRGLTPASVDAGASFTWGLMSAVILNPQTTPTGDENEDSIVMTVDFESDSLLFTGDIGFSTETDLVNQGVLRVTDVLKVAHHGSAYSSGENFLNAANPAKAVISVGVNSYGHPASDTLTRLLNVGTSLYRTDLNGNVTFTLDGSEPFMGDIVSFLPLMMLGGGSSSPSE